MNIAVYRKNLRNLKANVYGHYGDIAKKANVSKGTVSQVLNGEWVNQSVLKAAKEVEADLIKQQEALAKMIAS